MIENPDKRVLLIGAKAISDQEFDGAVNPRQVYRLAEEPDLGFFKVLNKLACFQGDPRRRLEARAQLDVPATTAARARGDDRPRASRRRLNP